MIFSSIRQEFQCWVASGARSISPPSRSFLFSILLVSTLVHGSALDKRVCGELFNREALRRVKAACIDTSYLGEAEALDIRNFVAKESQPGHLLRRMPWDLSDDCAAPDAVIRVYFTQAEVIANRTEVSSPCNVSLFLCSGSRSVLQGIQIVLLIYDRASVRILYRTQAQYNGAKRKTMLRGSFSRLVKDLKGVQSLSALPRAPCR